MIPSAFDGNHADEYAAFLAIADAGSFADAAARIQRHPSVVSKRISSLESRIGIRLIERSTRQLRLTEAGLRFLDRLTTVTKLIEEAEHEAGERSPIVTGALRIALPGALGRLWLSPLMTEFAVRHPSLSVTTEYSDVYVDLVAGGFDAAIRVGALEDSRLVARRLCSHTRILCASPAYVDAHGMPRHPAELSGHTCLGHSGLRTFPDWELSQGRTRTTVITRSTFTSNDGEALLDAARQGLGILGASNWLVARDIAQGALVQVLSGWKFDTASAVYLVRPSSKFNPPKTLAFKRWIEACFAQGAPWDLLPGP